MPDDLGNGRVSLREYMAAIIGANDKANAQRFDAIQKQLVAMAESHKTDHGDHEERLRAVEVRESASAAKWEAHKTDHATQARNQTGISAAMSAAIGLAIAAWEFVQGRAP